MPSQVLIAANHKPGIGQTRRSVLSASLLVPIKTFPKPMGGKFAKQADPDRGLREECIFCKIITGQGSRVIFENDSLVAFHDIRPAAKVHLLVIPKSHIVSTKDLRNNEPDKALVREMLRVGRALIQELDPGAETKFGFHDPPFLSVPHLHLHCFALPHTSRLAGMAFIVSRRGNRGFATPEQILARLEDRAVST